MEEPSLAFQRALVAMLKADSGVAAHVAGRVYDRVPESPIEPYIRIGDDMVVSDGADCFERSVDVSSRIHVFSIEPGKVQAKRICAAIVDAMDSATLNVGPDWALAEVSHNRTVYLDDPDGLTTHGIVDFQVYMDPA